MNDFYDSTYKPSFDMQTSYVPNSQPVNQPSSSLFDFKNPISFGSGLSNADGNDYFSGLNRIEEAGTNFKSNFNLGSAGPTSSIDGTPSFLHKLLGGDSNQIGPSNWDYLMGNDEIGTGILSPLVTGAESIMGYLEQKQQNKDYRKYTRGLINNANQEIALQTEEVQKARHKEAMTNFNRDPNTYSNPGLYNDEYKKNNPVV